MSTFSLWPPAEVFSTNWISANSLDIAGFGVGIAILALAFHFWLRGNLARKLTPKYGQLDLNLRAAFLKTSGWIHSIFTPEPAGWGNYPPKLLLSD